MPSSERHRSQSRSQNGRENHDHRQHPHSKSTSTSRPPPHKNGMKREAGNERKGWSDHNRTVSHHRDKEDGGGSASCIQAERENRRRRDVEREQRNGGYDRRRSSDGGRDRSTGAHHLETFRSSGHGLHQGRDHSHNGHHHRSQTSRENRHRSDRDWSGDVKRGRDNTQDSSKPSLASVRDREEERNKRSEHGRHRERTNIERHRNKSCGSAASTHSKVVTNNCRSSGIHTKSALEKRDRQNSCEEMRKGTHDNHAMAPPHSNRNERERHSHPQRSLSLAKTEVGPSHKNNGALKKCSLPPSSSGDLTKDSYLRQLRDRAISTSATLRKRQRLVETVNPHRRSLSVSARLAPRTRPLHTRSRKPPPPPPKCSSTSPPANKQRKKYAPTPPLPHASMPPLKRSRLSKVEDGGNGSAGTLSTTSTTKISFDELSNTNTTADDYEELTKVDKWVRSAPDELYYTRLADGHTTATERTQTLCEKFSNTLLVKSKEMRVQAELEGSQRMTELIQQEMEQLAEMKKMKKRQKAMCKHHNHHHHSSSETNENSPSCSSNSPENNESPVEVVKEESPFISVSQDKQEDIEDTGCEQISEKPDESKMTEQVKSNDAQVVLASELANESGRCSPCSSIEEGELREEDEENVEKLEKIDVNPKDLTESAVVVKETKSQQAPCEQRDDANSAANKTTNEHKCKKACTAPESNEKKDDVESKEKVLKKKRKAKKVEESSSSESDDDDSESDDDTSSDDSDDEGFSMTRSDTANRELERRKKHPRRLHVELWHNDPGLMNDGPVCRCSAKARRFGIRHGFYPGENPIPPCDMFTNNKSRLYHYRITISPPKNFLISTPTVINHDGHEYIFEGFSIFSHYKLDLNLPPCKVIRFNIRYDVFVEEERFPESFCVQELLLFETYLFREILELVDLKYDWNEETGCSQFHLMPRFVRQLPDNGQEVLSMNRVLIHLLKSDRELVKEEDLHKLYTVEQSEWQNFADRHKGTIVTKWGMKPCAIRVDQIDRDVSGQEIDDDDGIPFPLIVHFGIRPPQLSYAGNAGYQRAWRRYVKYRHLLSNMPKPSAEDKMKLLKKEMKLQAMRTASNMKRDVTVAISSKGFRTTGICCDLVQHAMLIPVLAAHLRFHRCLETLESTMVYTFQNRYLLQLAMTHPSYRENFGTNPDHARNALTNCGIRQPEYGDRRIHYASTRKRGINTLINIMAKFGADQETESEITHNERLEFLGDAVVEFITSIHLFHIFPDLEEGGLATYRAAIVQNQHLAVLAQALNLDQYMLYAHGSDLCHDSELRHAMANCFEALMGALFLDGTIDAADRVFGNTLFGTNPLLLWRWAHYPKHPLQQEEPKGDRQWVSSHTVLQKLAEFETSIGIQFNHIRLLARAFTDRSLGYNNLTRGSNQRLEFLGDTVLQLISSEYLYRHFPDHHEGHLSLLRSSLVNNRTQSLVCDDLGMPLYAMRGDPKSEMKTKDRADLLEAFLGALYIDKGLKYCHTFCRVCFFPRLSNSITKQEWNDPKSKLQQCCLTLRAMDGREPDIPVYKVTESLGPTNTRTYIVAVYFRSKRLATAQGHSIQEAEMNAAALALEVSGHLFPQLHHQKRIMDKTKKITFKFE